MATFFGSTFRGSKSDSKSPSSPTVQVRGKDPGLLRKWSLNEFEFLTTLGTGTFGRVRLVKVRPGILDSSKPQYFAMKILKKAELIRLKQVDHIKSEKAILQMIDHPFVVNLFGAMQDEKNLYMLLEFVIGGELFSHLRKAGRFSNEATKFYAASIVLAMQHLHSQDIVYRDLKPENLLLDSDGYLKITDFGFAKKVEDRTWTLCGTPEYLAPEIIQSKGHGKAVDWWALGILIYEMLAGYPPFYDENPFGIYQKILAGKIEFPRHFDVQAKELIKKLLTADRSKRIGNLKNGADDIIKHKWFRNFDWEALKRRTLTPPIKPFVQSVDDTSNFDQYPESDDDGPSPGIDFQSKNYFEDFDKA
eukprot:TRINITY_DN8220_c0_g1::TRINITY_DN8220_c0_g1_i1::g.10194::m.10194 TRINITY_DN8220_c0_g1::TRINITY_DN8220_c0_g1_i1::g.10194  ORF type:complete len:362 (-),score=46.25,sp/P51817/PRKX_HUMAN/57.70/3e-142,Pkinase/PF00069.20/6.2e-68,Pkinase_Tyr/PF07714.12/7.7e-37,Kinase-like/PF14531.1/7.2e-08,Seadorna_VP7/PF07387.6/0.1 TRINITY_DN8220_c0_g1_i1:853-1938(-)